MRTCTTKKIEKNLFEPGRFVYGNVPGGKAKQEAEPIHDANKAVAIDEQIQNVMVTSNEDFYKTYKPIWDQLFPAGMGAVPPAPATPDLVDDTARNNVRFALQNKIISNATREEQDVLASVDAKDSKDIATLQGEAIAALNRLAAGGDKQFTQINKTLTEFGPVQAANKTKIENYLKEKSGNEAAKLELEVAKEKLAELKATREELGKAVEKEDRSKVGEWFRKQFRGWGGLSVLGVGTGAGAAAGAAALGGALTLGGLPLAAVAGVTGLWYATKLATTGINKASGALSWANKKMGGPELGKIGESIEEKKARLLDQFDKDKFAEKEIDALKHLDGTTKAFIKSYRGATPPTTYLKAESQAADAEKAATTTKEKLTETTTRLEKKENILRTSAGLVKKQLDYYEAQIKETSGAVDPALSAKVKDLREAFEKTTLMADAMKFARDKMATDADIASAATARALRKDAAPEKAYSGVRKGTAEDIKKRADSAVEALNGKTLKKPYEKLSGAQSVAFHEFMFNYGGKVVSQPAVFEVLRKAQIDPNLITIVKNMLSLPVDHPRRETFMTEFNAMATEVKDLETQTKAYITTNILPQPHLPEFENILNDKDLRAKLHKALAETTAPHKDDKTIKKLFIGTDAQDWEQMVEAVGNEDIAKKMLDMIKEIPSQIIVSTIKDDREVAADADEVRILSKKKVLEGIETASKEVADKIGTPNFMIKSLNIPDAAATDLLNGTLLQWNGAKLTLGGTAAESLPAEALPYLLDTLSALKNYMDKGWMIQAPNPHKTALAAAMDYISVEGAVSIIPPIPLLEVKAGLKRAAAKASGGTLPTATGTAIDAAADVTLAFGAALGAATAPTFQQIRDEFAESAADTITAAGTARHGQPDADKIKFFKTDGTELKGA